MRLRELPGDRSGPAALARGATSSPVLFCRAALRAMAPQRASGAIGGMRRAANIYSRRIRLSSREIAIALALTVAAASAIIAAIDRVRQPLAEAPVVAAEDPAPPASSTSH